MTKFNFKLLAFFCILFNKSYISLECSEHKGNYQLSNKGGSYQFYPVRPQPEYIGRHQVIVIQTGKYPFLISQNAIVNTNNQISEEDVLKGQLEEFRKNKIVYLKWNSVNK